MWLSDTDYVTVEELLTLPGCTPQWVLMERGPLLSLPPVLSKFLSLPKK